jgi:UDP-N-acetylmuramoylalanine--D-glutamate ligase
MRLRELKGKKILLLGYGIENQSVFRFLKNYDPEISLGIADQKDGPDYLEKQTEYDLVVRTPGIPKRFVTRPSTTALNLFFGNVRGAVVGITGTKGKSTTASLIHEILSDVNLPSRLVGNIGNPMLDALRDRNNPEDIFVCELSSYQLDDFLYAPKAAILLNIFPDHLDYHGGFDNYWEAKKRIAKFQTENDWLIYNPDDPRIASWAAAEVKARCIPFVRDLPFPDSAIPLLGKHNRDNVRAAVAAARIFSASDGVICEAVKNFRPLPHRLEKIGVFNGISFYDDAISTTPESAIAAIEAIPEPIATLLLGGTDRGYDFRNLARLVLARGIPNVVLFPESGTRILAALKEKGVSRGKEPLKILETRRMEEAVRFSFENSGAGSSCVLSTASPSYTLWKNFEEKGNEFRTCVFSLAKEFS